nr:hypothetical protein [Tanacetum cinerariifolium]
MAGENIGNLTMEQYFSLTRGNQAPGVVRPKIRGSVNFEIKSQFMRELRKDTFLGNKNDDAHNHIKRVLDIVSLFNILGVTHDAVMLRVFPITLTEAAKRMPALQRTSSRQGIPPQRIGFTDNETQEDEIMEGSKAVTKLDVTTNLKQTTPVKKTKSNKPKTKKNNEVKMNPRCSALLQNWLPPKEEYPGSFILPYSIGRLEFNNALVDLGASISIMPFSMYKRFGMGKLEPINMESTNDDERVDIEWEELSFNNWVRIKLGKVCKMTRGRILKDYWRNVFNEAELENKEDSKEYEAKLTQYLKIILEKADET